MCDSTTLFRIHTYNYAERVSVYVPCKLADDAHAYSDGYKEHLGEVAFSWDSRTFSSTMDDQDKYTIRWETQE